MENCVSFFLQDDENIKLRSKLKEVEEDRTRLQRTISIQQTQIDKHRALAEESTKKCDSLQVQVSALHKVCVHFVEVQLFLKNESSNVTLSAITSGILLCDFFSLICV